MSPVVLYTALLMGLAGSIHCAGMCGPIVWVMPFQQYSGVKKAVGIAMYNIGRVSVYAALGVILHTFRRSFNPCWQQHMSVGIGIALLVIGMLYFLPITKNLIRTPWAGWVSRRLSDVMRRANLIWLLFAGMLNGLLPCGMVYMALAAAVIVPTPLHAALVMYAFGFGTLPMMVAITILKSRAPLARFQGVRKWTPVVMLVFGGLFVVRGANLGIPWISPKIVTAPAGETINCGYHPH